jgi:hypothetical protein
MSFLLAYTGDANDELLSMAIYAETPVEYAPAVLSHNTNDGTFIVVSAAATIFELAAVPPSKYITVSVAAEDEATIAYCGEDVPIPTLPVASITNGVASGFVESSTLIASPFPVCVTRNAASDEAVSIINDPVKDIVLVFLLKVKLEIIAVNKKSTLVSCKKNYKQSNYAKIYVSNRDSRPHGH